jgi:glycosyltransferase involved in cell wall biosynthesis
VTSVEEPRVSIVVTAYDEGDQIATCLDRLFEAVTIPCEVLVVVDAPDDGTMPALEKYAADEPRLRPTVNTYGRGPAFAIRYGFDHATAPVVVITMADLCDDPWQIDQLTRLVERGVAVAAASRYMRGGAQLGTTLSLKTLLSRAAGLSLWWFARVGTHDATNSFKAYRRSFVEEVGVESDAGFEVGLELVAKARRLRLPVAEVPTVWLDRTAGTSSFHLAQWLPKYLRWYRFAFGRPLTVDQIRSRTEAR